MKQGVNSLKEVFEGNMFKNTNTNFDNIFCLLKEIQKHHYILSIISLMYLLHTALLLKIPFIIL